MLSGHIAIEENTVGMEVTELGNRLTRITLSGRLDTPGVGKVETLFVASVVPGAKSTIVDLSGVEFVASMSIRMFISVARSLRQREAKLALYGAQSMVNEVFENVSLREIIPIVADETEAISAVLS
jgi:anti-sigma B factor antagonist